MDGANTISGITCPKSPAVYSHIEIVIALWFAHRSCPA
jgi:hypothetical protein